MNKKLLTIYRVPFLTSLTLAIVLIAVNVTRDPLTIALTFTGALIGTFFLDLEYVIHSFFLEPKTDFSKTFSTFVKHRDFPSAAQYIQIHKHEIREKTLNSALFQVIFAFFTLFVVTSTRHLFMKSLTISVLANSIYRLIEVGYEKRLGDWFWAMKEKPNQQTVSIYTIGLIGLLIYCISQF